LRELHFLRFIYLSLIQYWFWFFWSWLMNKKEVLL
jgi:hypothetical protein